MTMVSLTIFYIEFGLFGKNKWPLDEFVSYFDASKSHILTPLPTKIYLNQLQHKEVY